MRRLLPDSLPAWTIVIVVAGLAVVAGATLLLAASEQQSYDRLLELFRLDERVTAVADTLLQAAPGDRPRLADSLSNATLLVRIEPAPRVAVPRPADPQLAEFVDVLQDALPAAGAAIRVARVDSLPADLRPGPAAARGGESQTQSSFDRIALSIADGGAWLVSLRLGDGWLNLFAPIAAGRALLLPESAGISLAVLLVVLAAVALSLRRLTQPYARLVVAAQRIGTPQDTSPLPEFGVREARAAAQAFNSMRERLRRLLGERALLAASIAHDLRTPVTRLRLRSEGIADPALRALVLRDLDEMEAMTQSILAFTRAARGDGEPPARLDLVSLLEALCDELPGAHFREEAAPPRLICRAQPLALKRCLANLIDNAVRYGGAAEVALAAEDGRVRVTVDDAGPGLPEAALERAFAPFERLGASGTGGSGLGLAIARAIAQAQGGAVTLANRPAGGLRATLTLPL